MKCKLINPNYRENYVYNLLRRRGVEDVEEYLSPSAKNLQHPKYFKNIGIAAALYLRIVTNMVMVWRRQPDGFLPSLF